MISVVKVKYDEVAAGLAPRLFRSDQPGLADGAQQRDFIWVDDVVDVMLWLLDTPAVSGLFNVGTGQARSYRDLAHAVCDAAGVARRMEFIDMPAALRGQYQSFTEARWAACAPPATPGQFTPLEEGVRPLRAGLSGAARSLPMIAADAAGPAVSRSSTRSSCSIGPFGIRWYALAYIARAGAGLAAGAPAGAARRRWWQRRCRWTTS